MTTIDLRELESNVSEILHEARENGEVIEVTEQGSVLAFLVPVGATGPEAGDADEMDLDALVAEISKYLPEEVVRQVKSGETVQLVEGGKAVATITPVQSQPPYSQEEAKAFLAEIERIAEELGKYWPDGVSAVDAVRDVRREL